MTFWRMLYHQFFIILMILSYFYQSTVILFSFITLFSILHFMTFSSMIKMTYFHNSNSFIVHFSIQFSFMFLYFLFFQVCFISYYRMLILFPDLIISEQVFSLNLLVSFPLFSILLDRFICDFLNNVPSSLFSYCIVHLFTSLLLLSPSVLSHTCYNQSIHLRPCRQHL